MTIAILCPSRDREKSFHTMERSIYDTKSNDGDVILLSGSNSGQPDYTGVPFPKDIPTVHMWNVLADAAHCASDDVRLFMLGADDTIFTTPLWDEALIEHYNSLKNKVHVYAFQDSRDPDGTPHPIITREYMDAMGYFMPPIFMHWFVDTWTVEIAKANNCFTHLKDYLLVHDKPSDGGQPDETHNRIRRNGWHRRDQKVNHTCQHILSGEKYRLGIQMGSVR